jgi:hypothetical protein
MQCLFESHMAVSITTNINDLNVYPLWIEMRKFIEGIEHFLLPKADEHKPTLSR